jgi:hypothetical protein
MRVYIAGPMTGMPEYNHPAFFAAEDQLRSMGYSPINPARQFSRGVELPYEVYLRTAIQMVIISDAICLLPGWRRSKGAQLERHIADALGMEVMYIG